MPIIFENLLRRRGNVLGIGLERCAKSSQIGEAFLFRDRRHLRLNAIDLAQPDLMDLVRRHVRRRPRVDIVFVALLAVGQGCDRQRCPPFRRIYLGEEFGKTLVSRNHIRVDGVSDLLRQSLLLFGRNLRRIFLRRQKKRIGVDNPLALHRQLLNQESHRHQLVLHARAQHFGRLAKHPRNLVQPRNVVLVVLHRVERHRQRQIGKSRMDSILLIDRHLVLFEVKIRDPLLKHP